MIVIVDRIVIDDMIVIAEMIVTCDISVIGGRFARGDRSVSDDSIVRCAFIGIYDVIVIE